MKSFFTVCLILFTCSISFSQKSIIDKDSLKIKNIVGFSPSKTNSINGLTIKYWYDLDYSVKTNGLELDVNPLNIFFPFLAAVHFSEILKEGPPSDDINNINTVTFDKINGIRLGLASLEPATVNGLEVNMSGSFETLLNGVSVTPLVNKHYKVNGIGVGILGNADTQVSGMQIGLFNTCRKLRGIQLGLWNKNAKRSLPFINWQFKD
ncbi:LA_2272 family surface repeat-containing protein [Winogradskyella immobilis]|uniref:Uncharacterized protein n=1 Tax=Winogradskyella immobilis TaxID=2816852 RepID=A0ABS8EJK4_9FLAO|nr:hypothetical protein [Winogradskyella immobilis]MCC1483216.1 hypothetical protein [Winogradskyella immobilis]MCG0015310.1 hypothetical protein [Winogradskyella immobilis]